MAMKILAGDVGRADLFFIDPKEIVVNETLNGRWEPHDDDAVASLVKSFEDEGGQLQPVQVRRLPDKRVQLVMGYRRYKASVKYNELHPDDPMKLKCIVVEINDEDALRRNIVENRERKQTTPMDDAFTQRRLRENYGWNDSRIAEFYRCTPPYVGTLKKLLSLPNEVQKMVHFRTLSVEAAIALADLPSEEQRQVLGDIPVNVPATVAPLVNDPAPPPQDAQPQGKPETLSQAVKRKVRDTKIAAGGKQARNLREVRQFLEGLTGPAEKPGVKALAELFLKFIQGYYTDKTMTSRIGDLFPAQEAVATTEPTPPVVPEPTPMQTPESNTESVSEHGKPAKVGQDLPVVEVSESELTDVA